MNTIIEHTAQELRSGLACAMGGVITTPLRAVEDDLRRAGFLTGVATVTPAGRRFLDATGGCTDSPRLAA